MSTDDGITITAGDIRTPLLVRLFSRRERWFDRHRMCRADRRYAHGWDGSILVTWQCRDRQCKQYGSAYTEGSGYPFTVTAGVVATMNEQHRFSEELPDGLRIEWRLPEWRLPGAGDYEAVAADMGIDPAAPMTRQQHAVFCRRMDERIAGRDRGELRP